MYSTVREIKDLWEGRAFGQLLHPIPGKSRLVVEHAFVQAHIKILLKEIERLENLDDWVPINKKEP